MEGRAFGKGIWDKEGEALQELQDRVPPFDHETARQIVREELGAAGEDLLETMGDHPIAAATLGQVYRAEVNGKLVALKVQRPGVMRGVAADSFIIRSAAGALEMLRNPMSGERLIKPALVAAWSVFSCFAFCVLARSACRVPRHSCCVHAFGTHTHPRPLPNLAKPLQRRILQSPL